LSVSINLDTGLDHALQRDQIDRLYSAEMQGLRFAILCRTLALFAGFVWFFISYQNDGEMPRVWGFMALGLFLLLGIVYYFFIGSKFDRPWLKYVIYTLDVLTVCGLFAFVPIGTFGDVPQIFSMRAYGIHYILVFLGLACLSLSWGLVLWTGLTIVLGWWSAFFVIVSKMENPVTWGDLPSGATREELEALFMSFDFVGTGSRFEETGIALVMTIVLSVAVYQARRVFFAQVKAERDRDQERDRKDQVLRTLGRYVPEAVADRILEDQGSLAPQVKTATVLVADIENFSGFAENRPPSEVIETLNIFLAGCADEISACQGVVVTYMGDGFLATFNVPIEVEDPVQCALEAAKGLLRLSREQQFADQYFRLRIGIATGEIAAGVVGSSSRQAFTVYGETVNRAARLETLCKEFGTQLLMDYETGQRLSHSDDRIESKGKHLLRGWSEPQMVFTVSSLV